jgi:hypothetical protein
MTTTNAPPKLLRNCTFDMRNVSYEKTVVSFAAVQFLIATMIWLK